MTSGQTASRPDDRIIVDSFYTDAKDPRQTFDLAIPPNASGSTGLILCIHGGGWIEGSKSSYADFLKNVSGENGFAAASINYRYVSETVGFDDVLDDVTAALSAIRAAGEARGVRFNKVLLTGISAGGHLSLLYAYTRKDTAPIKPVCVVELCGPTDLEDDFYYSEDTSVSKAVGAAYFRNIISHGVKHAILPDDFDAARPALKKYSPIRYMDSNTVPTVFGHGEQDEIVPYQNALDLNKALIEYGVEHTFVSFPNSGHNCEDDASVSRFMDLFFKCAEKYLK